MFAGPPTSICRYPSISSLAAGQRLVSRLGLPNEIEMANRKLALIAANSRWKATPAHLTLAFAIPVGGTDGLAGLVIAAQPG